jgi:hypothetical protein
LDSRSSVYSNPAGFSDGEVDGLIAEMGTVEIQERPGLLRRLGRLAMNRRPYVMIYQKPLKLVVDRRMANISPHPMWPEVWPVDMVNLDPFKPKPPEPSPPPASAGPLVEGFDHPVAEPFE